MKTLALPAARICSVARQVCVGKKSVSNKTGRGKRNTVPKQHAFFTVVMRFY
jgi:hypothetical protein